MNVSHALTHSLCVLSTGLVEMHFCFVKICEHSLYSTILGRGVVTVDAHGPIQKWNCKSFLGVDVRVCLQVLLYISNSCTKPYLAPGELLRV